MNALRAALDEIAADAPEYGDLDRAIREADNDGHRQWRLALAAAAVLVVILGTLFTRVHDDGATGGGRVGDPLDITQTLTEGPLDPGRYRYAVTNTCDAPPVDCPTAADPPAPLDVAFTVPAGWQSLPGYSNVITPVGDTPTEAPAGGALVLGWTNSHVGLYSDPCRPSTGGDPDIAVGPTVDDFVDAVQALRGLDVTAPVDATVGGHPARFFTLDAPGDLSGCDTWRPWDPGFYAQGPSNHWDVWVVDVNGSRVLIVTNYFPGTPQKVKDELAEMVESMALGG